MRLRWRKEKQHDAKPTRRKASPLLVLPLITGIVTGCVVPEAKVGTKAIKPPAAEMQTIIRNEKTIQSKGTKKGEVRRWRILDSLEGISFQWLKMFERSHWSCIHPASCYYYTAVYIKHNRNNYIALTAKAARPQYRGYDFTLVFELNTCGGFRDHCHILKLKGFLTPNLIKCLKKSKTSNPQLFFDLKNLKTQYEKLGKKLMAWDIGFEKRDKNIIFYIVPMGHEPREKEKVVPGIPVGKYTYDTKTGKVKNAGILRIVE